MKLALAEGETNESEFRCWSRRMVVGLFCQAGRRCCGMTILFLPIDFLFTPQQGACSYVAFYSERVDALVVVRGSSLTPPSFTSWTALKFDEATVNVRATAGIVLVLECSYVQVNSWRNNVDRKTSPWFYYTSIKQNRIRYSFQTS